MDNLSVNPPSTNHQPSLNDPDYTIADSGMSGNYLHVQATVLDKVLIYDDPTVLLPDDTTIKESYKGTL